MARKIEVEILGDSSSLERAFASSARSAQKFNQQLASSTTTGNLKAQTSALQKYTRAEEDLFKVRARRSSSLGPFRVAGVGLAAGLGLFAATQAVRELAAALETTGTAALTTGGRIKNMVAALTSGNLLGAVDALVRGARTLEEMGRSTTAASTARIEALQAIASGTISRPEFRRGNTAEQTRQWKEYAAAAELAGTGNKELAQAALDILGPLKQSTVGIQAMEWWTDRLGKTVKTASGELVTFKGAADDLDRLRGPGGIALSNAAVEARPGRPTIKPLSPSQRRELDLIGAEATARVPLLEDRLKQLNNQIKRGNINQTQRLKILTNIKNTEAEIAGIYADQAAKRKADADDAAAAAAAAAQQRIATKTGWLMFGIEQAEATKTVKDDVTGWRALEKYLLERIRQEGRTLELVSELWRARQAITDLNKKKAGDPLAGLMQVSTKKLTGILAAGTGLTGGGRKALAANISGAQIQTYVNVSLDGQQVAKSVTTSQKRAGKRTGKQTSGRR